MLKKDLFKKFLNSYNLKIDNYRYESFSRYEILYISPSLGEKISKYERLKKEFALLFKSQAIPTIEFKSGEIKIKFETNSRNSFNFENVLDNSKYNIKLTKNSIPIAIGLNQEDESYFIDLNKDPHILIGGSSGSGKTVLLKSIMKSIQFNNEIEDSLKFIISDPKQSEFSNFSDDKNLLWYLKTNRETGDVLEYLNEIMENRYSLYKDYNVNSLNELNEKLAQDGKALESEIIHIIDEFGELFYSENSGKKCKKDFTSLIQKGRAAGIHLICATQRPSRDLIDGAIKSNFSTLIGLKVNSFYDSKIIIDEGGAEKLTRKGDCLIKASDSTLSRIQVCLP